jgi:hypothetical protein
MTIASKISDNLEEGMDAQYVQLDLDEKDEFGVVVSWAATWNGTTTVTTAHVLVAGDYIRLLSNGNWFKVTTGTTGGHCHIEDVFSVGIPTGTGPTARAVTAPPDPITGTGGLDTFSDAIAGAFATEPHELPVCDKRSLPAATPAGRLIYVSNDVGGATIAFSDGSNWRRAQDRNVVS